MNPESIVPLLSEFGLPGLILILWFISDRRYARLLDVHRTETAAILRQYREDFKEVKSMYLNNVELVNDYSLLASNQHATVAHNAATMQSLRDAINSNQYCPWVRNPQPTKEVSDE